MDIKTKYNIGDTVVVNEAFNTVSTVVNIMTSTFKNEDGVVITNRIYTFANGDFVVSDD